MQLQARTQRIGLLNCDLELLKTLLEGDDELAAYLGCEVPENWSEFGSPAFSYALEKIQAIPRSQPWWVYLPIHLPSNTLIGSCGFKGLPDENGMVEIGYEISTPFRNQGLATEVTALLLELAYRSPEVKSVQAHTLAEENASVKVLRKNGFAFVAAIEDPEEGAIWRWVNHKH